jgi:hypothetical protein
VFYVETLADLEKEVAGGKTPEAVVGNLAEKTPSGAAPNVYHRQLILGELVGHKIAMTGQVIIGGGETKRGAPMCGQYSTWSGVSSEGVDGRPVRRECGHSIDSSCRVLVCWLD